MLFSPHALNAADESRPVGLIGSGDEGLQPHSARAGRRERGGPAPSWRPLRRACFDGGGGVEHQNEAGRLPLYQISFVTFLKFVQLHKRGDAPTLDKTLSTQAADSARKYPTENHARDLDVVEREKFEGIQTFQI